MQPATLLDDQRWSFVSNHRSTWIVRATPDGPRGDEVRRAGDEVAAFPVGDWIVFLAARTAEVFYVSADRANDTDDTVADAWIATQEAASRPRPKGESR